MHRCIECYNKPSLAIDDYGSSCITRHNNTCYKVIQFCRGIAPTVYTVYIIGIAIQLSAVASVLHHTVAVSPRMH